MEIIKTLLDDVLILIPRVFNDDRGFFMEAYHKEKYVKLGICVDFVQDNLSFSCGGTLRGLHYQHPHAQAKLVQVLDGHVFDVTVDIRSGSPTFGQWVGIHLSGENRKQVFIPAGFAHGFCVLSETAHCFHTNAVICTRLNCEGGVLWSDPDIGIDWPVKEAILSEKDAKYPRLKNIERDRLPRYK